MDLIGLMFRHTQYAFLNNFVEYFLGYHWERLDSYAMLLKLTYSQLMNMLREDGRLMQADIFSYDYHDRIELACWVNRLLIGRYKNKKDMFDTIIGKPLKSKLNLTNFSHIEQVDIISLLLKNATKQKEKGINILLYGDVGSGKTGVTCPFECHAAYTAVLICLTPDNLRTNFIKNLTQSMC